MTSPTRQPGGPSGQRPPVVIRDRRRIDPDTLQPRVPLPEPQDTPGPPGTAAAPSPQQLLTERTADLQRLKAEYDNYRHRVHRELEQTRNSAVAEVVTSLLPVLDTLDQARAHADLAGFESAAQELHERLGGLGLHRFGTVGDTFNPTRHQAVTTTDNDNANPPTITQVLRPGYLLGDYLLRPAHVAVTQTANPPAQATPERSFAPPSDPGHRRAP